MTQCSTQHTQVYFGMVAQKGNQPSSRFMSLEPDSMCLKPDSIRFEPDSTCLEPDSMLEPDCLESDSSTSSPIRCASIHAAQARFSTESDYSKNFSPIRLATTWLFVFMQWVLVGKKSCSPRNCWEITEYTFWMKLYSMALWWPWRAISTVILIASERFVIASCSSDRKKRESSSHSGYSYFTLLNLLYIGCVIITKCLA